jgi:hypothetical protein
MLIHLEQARLISRGLHVPTRLRKVPVGQRLHSGGDLQHVIQSRHRPGSPVEREKMLKLQQRPGVI